MSLTPATLSETLKSLVRTVPGAVACSIHTSTNSSRVATHQVRNAPDICDPALEEAMVRLLQTRALSSLKETLLADVQTSEAQAASSAPPRHREMQLLSPQSQRFALSVAEGRGVIVLTTTNLTRPAIAWAHLRKSASSVDTPKLARLLLATSERESS